MTTTNLKVPSPQQLGLVQAVTPKHGREWSNESGRFVYRSIKNDRFWGYRDDRLDSIPSQNRFFIAKPEKAILDLIYLSNGKWTKERINQMRFQSLEIVNCETLQKFSDKFQSPRLKRATKRFIGLYEKELEK